MSERGEIAYADGGDWTIHAGRSKGTDGYVWIAMTSRGRHGGNMNLSLTRQEARAIAAALENEAAWLDQTDACS